MGRNKKKWWFPPLENKKKPGLQDVVTIDGDEAEEDFDTVMGREVSCNHELRDQIIAGLAKGVVNCFTDLVPDGNDRFRLEPSPELAAIYPGQTLDQIKASLEVKLEYGIDMEPAPPQASEENEEDAAMMEIQKPAKRVKRSIWGPDAVFNCDQCPKSFNKYKSLSAHRQTHVNNPDKYQCKVCEKKFPNSVRLNCHRQTHVNNPDKYQCQVCDKQFPNSLRLDSHRRSHMDTSEKYSCNCCARKFPKYSMLYRHRRYHCGKTYECDTCQKVFEKSIQLVNHRRVHKRTGKKKKDKNAPKRPQPTFILWMNANREALKKENAGLSATELGKKAGEIWKSMDAKDKVEWADKYKKSREEYGKAMKDYIPTRVGPDGDEDEGEKSTKKKSTAKKSDTV